MAFRNVWMSSGHWRRKSPKSIDKRIKKPPSIFYRCLGGFFITNICYVRIELFDLFVFSGASFFIVNNLDDTLLPHDAGRDECYQCQDHTIPSTEISANNPTTMDKLGTMENTRLDLMTLCRSSLCAHVSCHRLLIGLS